MIDSASCAAMHHSGLVAGAPNGAIRFFYSTFPGSIRLRIRGGLGAVLDLPVFRTGRWIDYYRRNRIELDLGFEGLRSFLSFSPTRPMLFTRVMHWVLTARRSRIHPSPRS